MGGYGSTRWNSHYKKLAVEDCRKLPFSIIKKHLNVGWGSQITWSRNGEKIASIGYQVNGADEYPSSILLNYTITKADKEKIDYKYPVNLTTTPLPWGGSRYWFICPIVGCGRRVSVLYLAPGGKYFACRHCNRLSYRSRQDGYQDRMLYSHMANLIQDLHPGITWRMMKEVLKDR